MGRGADGDFASARPRRGDATSPTPPRPPASSGSIYLGGLGEPASAHLRSRHQTAEILAASGIPLTYFRAAAVIGAGSESFRVVYYLVKRLPAMVTPRWVETRTQPIAIADVVAYLRAAPGAAGERRPRDRDRRPRGDHLRRDDGRDGRGARPPLAAADPACRC